MRISIMVHEGPHRVSDYRNLEPSELTAKELATLVQALLLSADDEITHILDNRPEGTNDALQSDVRHADTPGMPHTPHTLEAPYTGPERRTSTIRERYDYWLYHSSVDGFIGRTIVPATPLGLAFGPDENIVPNVLDTADGPDKL